MKWLSLIAVAGVLAAAPHLQAGPDEEYIAIFQLMEDADRSFANNEVTSAHSKFQSAQEALTRFKKTYPTWNAGTVDYRLQYVNERLAKIAPPKTAAPVVQPTARPAADPLAELQQTVAQLQEERKVLNAKLAEALAAQPAAVDPRELQKAEGQINALQKEKELLRVELEQERAKLAKATDKEQAQQEIASLRSQLAAAAAPMTAMERELAAAREAARTNAAAVANLQTELSKLREEKPSNNTKPKTVKAGDPEAARELATLRARVATLEARKTPFTAEELALLKPGQGTIVTNTPVATRPRDTRRKELPPGAGFILAEAQRAFVAGRFDEAEAKYKEILKMDENNVHSLGNMGLIQMQTGKLQEAEATLQKALSLDPEDGLALSNLGILRYRQDKFDEAIDVLGRAAQVEPKNPITQNYLGISLAAKGLRAPAEAALRKSVELQPGYAPAHHNLAVIYAHSQPPYLELARYHYNKAQAAGYARDEGLEKILKGEAK